MFRPLATQVGTSAGVGTGLSLTAVVRIVGATDVMVTPTEHEGVVVTGVVTLVAVTVLR